MIGSSLACLMLSLLPFALLGLGVGLAFTWRLSSGLLALTWLALTAGMVIRASRKELALGPRPGLAIATLGFGAAVVVLQAACAAGVFGEAASGIFFVGLYSLLGMCVLFFVELFRAFDLSRVD